MPSDFGTVRTLINTGFVHRKGIEEEIVNAGHGVLTLGWWSSVGTKHSYADRRNIYMFATYWAIDLHEEGDGAILSLMRKLGAS